VVTQTTQVAHLRRHALRSQRLACSSRLTTAGRNVASKSLISEPMIVSLEGKREGSARRTYKSSEFG